MSNTTHFQEQIAELRAERDALQAVVGKQEDMLNDLETDYHCGGERDGRQRGGIWEKMMIRQTTAHHLKKRREEYEAAEAAQGAKT